MLTTQEPHRLRTGKCMRQFRPERSMTVARTGGSPLPIHAPIDDLASFFRIHVAGARVLSLYTYRGSDLLQASSDTRARPIDHGDTLDRTEGSSVACSPSFASIVIESSRVPSSRVRRARHVALPCPEGDTGLRPRHRPHHSGKDFTMSRRKQSFTEKRRARLAMKWDRLEKLETKSTITEPISGLRI